MTKTHSCYSADEANITYLQAVEGKPPNRVIGWCGAVGQIHLICNVYIYIYQNKTILLYAQTKITYITCQYCC